MKWMETEGRVAESPDSQTDADAQMFVQLGMEKALRVYTRQGSQWAGVAYCTYSKHCFTRGLQKKVVAHKWMAPTEMTLSNTTQGTPHTMQWNGL